MRPMGWHGTSTTTFLETLAAVRRVLCYTTTTRGAMYYIVDTAKSFDQASADLESSVKRHGFGVLHIHDLGTTLRSKGIAFDEECKVFEVCNPGQAAKVLSTDMRLNMALPCRISVFTAKRRTRIGLIKPVNMLSALSRDAALIRVAEEVEEATIRMVDEAR